MCAIMPTAVRPGHSVHLTLSLSWGGETREQVLVLEAGRWYTSMGRKGCMLVMTFYSKKDAKFIRE